MADDPIDEWRRQDGLLQRDPIFDDLQWTSAPEATGYRIHRAGLPAVEWRQIVMPPRPLWHRFRYWLGDKLEALSWKLRDGI